MVILHGILMGMSLKHEIQNDHISLGASTQQCLFLIFNDESVNF